MNQPPARGIRRFGAERPKIDVSIEPAEYPPTIFEETLAKVLAKELRKRRRLRKRKLPKKIIALENKDKKFHEKWYPGRDLLDIPHPFRMLLASKPNCGKTTVIINVIMRAAQGKKPFQRIVVIHCDPEDTKEYEDLDCEMLEKIPDPKEFLSDMKTLVILEDLNYMSMDKVQLGCLERLFGYVSTHKNISCMATGQDIFRIIPTVRRCTNIFVIWKSHDTLMIKALANKLNINPDKFAACLEEKCKTLHDSVWIDFTDDTPAPHRKNGYEIFLLQ